MTQAFITRLVMALLLGIAAWSAPGCGGTNPEFSPPLAASQADASEGTDTARVETSAPTAVDAARDTAPSPSDASVDRGAPTPDVSSLPLDAALDGGHE